MQLLAVYNNHTIRKMIADCTHILLYVSKGTMFIGILVFIYEKEYFGPVKRALECGK